MISAPKRSPGVGPSVAPTSVFRCGRHRLPLTVVGIALALVVVRVLSPGPAPPVRLTVAAGLAGVGVLLLALSRYEAAAALGMLLFGVVFVEPSPPDAVLGIVILVSVVTGRFSLSAVPVPMFVLVFAMLALNAVSAVFAVFPGRAVFFFTITAYLALFAMWLTGYVNSVERARSVIAPLVAGAVVSSIVGVAVLFASFPGKSAVDFSDGQRARGFFKDPTSSAPSSSSSRSSSWRRYSSRDS